MKLQESGQMYLETILILSKKMEHVRSLDVAEYMNFSKASISRAVGLLKDNCYIEIDKDGYITLTKQGHEIADSIYERHLIITKVLESLGVDKQTAEQDACKIEHDISDVSFNALKKYFETK